MSSLNLSFRLDEVGLEGPDDLLGEVRLCAGQQCIEEPTAYLDSWFVALFEGLQGLQSRPHVQITMLEEPHSLVFYLSQAGLRIAYGDQQVLLPFAEFAEALTEVAKEFLSKLQTLGIALTTENLQLIERYAT